MENNFQIDVRIIRTRKELQIKMDDTKFVASSVTLIHDTVAASGNFLLYFLLQKHLKLSDSNSAVYVRTSSAALHFSTVCRKMVL